MKTTIITEAKHLPSQPRVERVDCPPARPYYRAVYGDSTSYYGRDDLEAFEEHGRDLRHAAECAGLLETV